MAMPTFNCANCLELNALSDLVEGAERHEKNLEMIQTLGFVQLQDTLGKGFAKVAGVIQWGFQELSWNVQKQTDVLRAIERTLQTPSQTQANEAYLMAEELHRRGVFTDAESFFRKALALNRLDFRIYIGLAYSLLAQNKFSEALPILESSLPHAPKDASNEIEDKRSYSTLLIAHIHECNGDFKQACQAARRAS